MKKRKILSYETLNSIINYDLNNKELSLIHNDIKMNNSFIPLEISHIYQNNNKNTKYGKGFKLNIEQRLYLENNKYILENSLGQKEEFNEVIYYLDNHGNRVYTRENGKKLTREYITIINDKLEYNGNRVYIETKTETGLTLLNNYEGFSNSNEIELRNEDIASLEEEIKQINDTIIDINYYLNEYQKYNNQKYKEMLQAENDYKRSLKELKSTQRNSYNNDLINSYKAKKAEYLSLINISSYTVGGLKKTGESILYDPSLNRNTYIDSDGQNKEKYSVKLSYEGTTQVFNNTPALSIRYVDKYENMSDNEKSFYYYSQQYNDKMNKLNYDLQKLSTDIENYNYSYQKNYYDKQIDNLNKENIYISKQEIYEEEYLTLVKEYYNNLIKRSEYQLDYYNKLLSIKENNLNKLYQQYPNLFIVNQEGLIYGYNKYGYLCMIFDRYQHQLQINAEYEIDNGKVLSIKYLDINDSNNKIEFIYNENNQLIRIINDNDDYIDYLYNNEYLTNIKYLNNDIYTLTYKDNKLYSIIDIDNSGYRLDYNDKLLSISQIYNDKELYIDETISYTYDDNTIKVSSNKSNIINYYLFDELNNLIIEYSRKSNKLYGVTTYDYDNEDCSFTIQTDSKKDILLNEEFTGQGIKSYSVNLNKITKTDYLIYAMSKAESDLDIKKRRITDYCNHIEEDNNKYFEIRCEVIYPDYTKEFVSSFNPKITGLQFIAFPVTLDEDENGRVIIPEAINVIIDYRNNNGLISVNNLSFVEGDFIYTKYNEAHNKLYEIYSDNKSLKLVDGLNSGYYITKKKVYYSYNNKGLLEKQNEVISYEEYDINNNLISNNKKEYSINYIYDKNNKLIRSLDSLGNVEENIYNELGISILKRKYHKDLPNQAYIEEYEVDEDGKLLSSYNELGYKNKYNYINNTPISIETPGGNIINMKNSITSKSISADIDGIENYNSIIYDKGRLIECITNNMKYRYSYDYKGREEALYINDKLYVSFEYIEDIINSKLLYKTIYSNNNGYEKITDLYGKILEINIITNNDSSPYIKYQYDEDKLISEIYYLNDKVLSYNYNYIDNTLVGITTSDYTKTIDNDIYGNNIKINYQLEDSNITYNNSYEDNRITSIEYNNENIQTINYDRLNRIINLDNSIIKDNYDYLSKNGRTTNLISFNNKRIGNNYQRYKYLYDNEGNIINRIENHNNIRYLYDKLNRLIREDNQILNQSICYEYDSNGNIINKVIYPYTLEETKGNGNIIDYQYDNNLLKSYNNELVTYDELGNPIIYRNNKLTWNIKELTKYNNITFKYINGIRREKISSNKRNEYILDGNRILKEIITTYNSVEDVSIEDSSISTDKEEITYIYGINGIIGFDYLKNNINKRYYFNKNIFNDIIEIYDSDSNLVGKYEYDAYGNHRIITNIDNIANINPIRYRGYYYDIETNLYYLESRYYDPETARFISMDSIEYLDPENINGLNLYAYCGNNPVMRVDPSGNEWWHWVLGAFAVIAICALAVAVTALTGGTGSFLFAVSLGALKGSTIGLAVGAVVGAEIGAVVGGIHALATGGDFWSDVGNGALLGLGIGSFSGAIIGAVLGGYSVYSSTKIHSVYISKTNDVVTYVGRTNNITRRTTEHALAKRGIVPQEVASKLSLKQARGLEQALINNFKMVKDGGTLINKINSIARTNPIYEKAVAWGVKYISKFLKFLI